MSQLSEQEKELQTILCNIEIIHKEIGNKYKSVHERRTKNYEHIKKMRDFELKGYTVEPTTLEPLLADDADIRQKQKEALIKLLDIQDRTKQLKTDLRDLSAKYDSALKYRSVCTRRMKVWMKDV